MARSVNSFPFGDLFWGVFHAALTMGQQQTIYEVTVRDPYPSTKGSKIIIFGIIRVVKLYNMPK